MPPKRNSSQTLKYQPKAVERQSLEDRERREREETERQQVKARAAQDEAKLEAGRRQAQYGFQGQLRSQRGRGQVRGGRGGFMGDGPRTAREGQLTGIGGRAEESSEIRRSNVEGQRESGQARVSDGSRRRRTGSKGGQDSETQVMSQPVAAESKRGDAPAPKATEIGSQDTSVKKSENDDLDSDPSDTEWINLEDLNLLSETNGEMLPVTINRTEHVDRQFVVNTDSSANIAHPRAGTRKKNTLNVPEVKLESDEDKAEPTISDSKPKSESPSKLRSRPRRKPKTPHPRLASTQISSHEQELQDQDREILLKELGPVTSERTESNEPSNVDLKEPASFNPRENCLYLFQFPRLLPRLVREGAAVKEEASAESNAAPAGKTDQEVEIVKEEDTGGLPPQVPQKGKTDDLVPGHIGEMKVWKSGKVTFDWGGVPMQVNKGLDNNFVETVVGMQMNPKSDGMSNEYEGTAFSFGQIRGKMVVTPDWKTTLELKEHQMKRSSVRKVKRGEVAMDTED